MTFFAITNDLPAASLALPLLKARQRELVLAMADECTLGEVAEYLRTGRGGWELADAFNTAARQAQLKQSLDWFDRVGKAWMGKKRRDPRFNWVVPQNVTGHPAKRLLSAAVAPRIEFLARATGPRHGGSISQLHDLRVLTKMQKLLLGDESVDTWLRFMSIEGASALEKMRSSDRTLLMSMMAKGSRRLLGRPHHGPWEPGFPRAYRALPVTWLYQFDPCARAIAVTTDLIRVGYMNIGHLYVLSAGAWSIVKGVKSSDWRLLRKTLHEG